MCNDSEWREARLRARREYYRKNRERIRARDNASYRKRMLEHPEKVERARSKAVEYRKIAMEKEKEIDYDSLSGNPDREDILRAIADEGL